MGLSRSTRIGFATIAALATSLTMAPTATAQSSSHHHATGTSSLAALLAADGSGFDRNPNDFDILDNAVSAVLKAKPTSAVGVLADGRTRVTAFLPNDRAFRRLASDLTGVNHRTESGVFGALAGKLGVATIESALLYHVVPGATITYAQARRANGAVLKTALAGATIKVRVEHKRCSSRVTLVDADPNDANPMIVSRDLNRGNVQIGHGINRVLRPVNL